MRVDGGKPSPQKKTESPVGEKTTVHNIIISDASGSMSGGKYKASVQSISTELKLLSQDDNVNYTQTLVEFDSSRRKKHFWLTEGKEATSFKGIGASGGTPLYITIGEVLTELESKIKPNDRVLVKVFTDGDDTEYGRGTWDAAKLGVYLNKLINVNNWTITFNCTESDKRSVLRIGIPESNILTHNNTAEDIERVSHLRMAATQSYSKSVSAGVSAEELKVSFYSKSL
jgi:hypothetical protein